MFQNNLLMGAAAAASGGGASVVSVGNSALFDSANSESLSRTFDASNRRTWTFSTWLYRGLQGTNQNILLAVSGGLYTEIRIQDDNKFRVYLNNGGSAGDLKSSALLRDIGWYHLIIALDTTQAVASNRCIMYINGERVTSFTTENYPTLNLEVAVNTATSHSISASPYLNAYLAETVFIDGLQLAPTSFGAYDTSGLYWTPLSSTTIKALTFGTNGFYLDNTTNAQTDASGEGNNWTNNNTVVTTTNSPTNSAALLNPLSKVSGGNVLSVGNTRLTGPISGFNSGIMATLPCDSGGKWYWEIRINALYTTNAYHAYGVSPSDLPRNADAAATSPGNTNYQGGKIWFQGTTDIEANALAQDDDITSALTVSAGDILQIAFDDATQKLWYGLNNTWYNSGNPATGANPSSTLTATDKTWYPWFGMYQPQDITDINMGSNPTFNGAVTAQNNADGNGEGNFYYAPPSGFLTINTNNIASETTRTASDTNKYFQTVLYEGNGAGQRVGAFQPFTDTYTIAKSALFNSDNSEYFNRTFGSGGDTTDWGYSIWYKYGKETTDDYFLSAGVHASTTFTRFMFDTGGGSKASIDFTTFNSGGSVTGKIVTTQELEDSSVWNHLLIAWDSDNSTAGDRMRMYINGNRVTVGTFTNPSSGEASRINVASAAHMIGSYNAGTSGFADGYMADVAFINGFNAAGYGPANFGQTDTSTNKWVPKDISGLTYGDTSFRLDFSNGSDLGEDQENSNDWTNNNTVTQTTDSPTTNITVLSPNRNSVCVGTLSNGNRTVVTGSSQYGPIWTEMALSSGKWYWESVWTVGSYAMIGITTGKATSTTQQLGYLPDDVGLYSSDGKTYTNNVAAASAIGTYAVDDVMGIALDMDTKTVKFYKNNSLLGTVNLPSNDPYYPAFADWVNSQTVTWVTRFASADWSYSAPAGHVAITQDNISSSDQFISAFSWIKNRDATDNHMLFDRVRGVYKDIHSNDMVDEVTNVNTLQQFLAGGVQVGNDVEVNTANESYVLWNWMMEATGTGSSNTDGTINTTSTLVDQTLGMSISTYVGTGSNATIGHGLGVKPGLILLKVLNIGGSAEWIVYHKALTTGSALFLNSSSAQAASTGYFNNTQPTSSVFTVGNSTYNNSSGDNHVAYCFADSQFISVGKYTGNGNANGPYISFINSVGVPISPRWILAKNYEETYGWFTVDQQTSPYNVRNHWLDAATTAVEGTANNFDFVTGGAKFRNTGGWNNSNKGVIYLAIGTPIIDTDGRIIAGR